MENTENKLCPTCALPMNEGDHNHESTPEQAPVAPAPASPAGGPEATPAPEATPEAAPASPAGESAPAQPAAPEGSPAPAADKPAEGDLGTDNQAGM